MAPMLQTIMKQTRSRPIRSAPEVTLSAHSCISEMKDPGQIECFVRDILYPNKKMWIIHMRK